MFSAPKFIRFKKRVNIFAECSFGYRDIGDLNFWSWSNQISCSLLVYWVVSSLPSFIKVFEIILKWKECKKKHKPNPTSQNPPSPKKHVILTRSFRVYPPCSLHRQGGLKLFGRLFSKSLDCFFILSSCHLIILAGYFWLF